MGERLKSYGHRNWIVVADSAYPLQTSEGIETIYVGGDLVGIADTVLGRIDASDHVREKIYLDAELKAVAEADAHGIDEFRSRLGALLAGREVAYKPHADLIRTIASRSSDFQVFVIKTAETLPYSSVFIELDCKYWSPEAESRLRDALGESPKAGATGGKQQKKK